MAATPRTVLSESHRRAIGEGQRRRHERQRGDPEHTLERLQRRMQRIERQRWLLESEIEAARERVVAALSDREVTR
jgi:hypothetical protein